MSSNPLEQLLNDIKGNYEGFPARLREVPYDWVEDGLTVSGNFLYLAFRDGHPTVDEFAKFIYDKIIPFCVSRQERRKKGAKYVETLDERHIQDLRDKASNLFIKARNSRRTGGEPGELILFILLEAVLTAPQIACKMYLKTSEQMPVHGSDSIHISRGIQDGSICLIWGESKLYQQLASALDDICDSITSFLTQKEGRTAKDRDIDIIRDHVDIEDPVLREALLNFFDPYEEESNLCEEAFACFVGFDYSAYGQLSSMSPSDRESFFQNEYLQRVESACKLFGEKLKDNKLTHLRINYFLIPFPSVEELRQKFFAHLGVTL